MMTRFSKNGYQLLIVNYSQKTLDVRFDSKYASDERSQNRDSFCVFYLSHGK